MRKLYCCLVSVGLTLVLAAPSAALAKKKQPKIDMSALKADSVNSDVKKLKKDATVGRGFFNTWFNEKTGKLYLEIPDSALSRQYLLASRITQTSDGQDYVAGEVHARPFLISFSTDGRNVYMHEVQGLRVVRPGDDIAPSFQRNNMDPVLKGFKVAARDKESTFIDVTIAKVRGFDFEAK